MQRACFYLHLLIVFSTLCGAGFSATNPSPCTPPPTLQARLKKQANADAYAQVGMWYGDHEKYACAVEAYQAALKQEPRSSEYLYLLGLNLLRKGDVSGSIDFLRQSIEIEPQVLKPHLLLATALEESGRTVDARPEWMAALKIDPQSDIALDGASKNLLDAKAYDGVIALLGPEPKGEALILDLATAYEGAGEADQATILLRKALEENPASAPLTRALITSLVMQSHYQDAAQLAKGLIQQRPRDLDAQILYLHVLVLSDDEELARPLAKKLLLAAPHDFTVLYLNGVLQNRAGEYAQGRTYLEEAVKLNPNHYNSHYNLGISLANLDDPKDARGQFEKALALGATEPFVRFEYAKVLRKLGETTLAEEQLKLYQQEQKDQSDRNVAASKMAQADKEMTDGDPKKAVVLYRDALALLPQNAVLSYKLSVALDQVGDTAGEREALQKAVQIDPNMALAHHQLGYLAFSGGDPAMAESEFREAVRAAPGYAEAWISLAATLGTESKFPEAQQAVEHALEIEPNNTKALDLKKDLATAAGQPNP